MVLRLFSSLKSSMHKTGMETLDGTLSKRSQRSLALTHRRTLLRIQHEYSCGKRLSNHVPSTNKKSEFCVKKKTVFLLTNWGAFDR